ncbi:MAG: hypothetical protein HY823_14395 [Acidobacteria bacterium]|nr:hypothetical protein [Acidobacteriota bacterium]
MESENRRIALGGLAALLLAPLALGKRSLGLLPGWPAPGAGEDPAPPADLPRILPPDHSVMRRG